MRSSLAQVQSPVANPRFGTKSEHYEEPQSWWQTFCDFLAGFTFTPLNPKSHFKIRANDPIADGTIISSGIYNERGLEWKANIDRTDVVPQSPMMLTAIRVDRRLDKTLMAYLNSLEVQELKEQVPSSTATPDEELHFLKALSRSTNRQFDHSGLSVEEQKQHCERDTYRAYQEQREQYNERGQTGEAPYHRTTRLLGHSMRKGVGVCRHRALLNALSIRHMDVPGLKATYTTGLVKDLLDRDSDFSFKSAHVWNVVTMPSGRKYIADPSNELEYPIRKVNGVKYPLGYVSLDHIFKHGNPNFNKPVFPRSPKNDGNWDEDTFGLQHGEEDSWYSQSNESAPELGENGLASGLKRQTSRSSL